jgi:hypothetical protein
MARASKSCGQPFIASLHLPNPDIPSDLEVAVPDYLGRTSVYCPMATHATDQSALNVTLWNFGKLFEDKGSVRPSPCPCGCKRLHVEDMII